MFSGLQISNSLALQQQHLQKPQAEPFRLARMVGVSACACEIAGFTHVSHPGSHNARPLPREPQPPLPQFDSRLKKNFREHQAVAANSSGGDADDDSSLDGFSNSDGSDAVKGDDADDDFDEGPNEIGVHARATFLSSSSQNKPAMNAPLKSRHRTIAQIAARNGGFAAFVFCLLPRFCDVDCAAEHEHKREVHGCEPAADLEEHLRFLVALFAWSSRTLPPATATPSSGAADVDRPTIRWQTSLSNSHLREHVFLLLQHTLRDAVRSGSVACVKLLLALGIVPSPSSALSLSNTTHFVESFLKPPPIGNSFFSPHTDIAVTSGFAEGSMHEQERTIGAFLEHLNATSSVCTNSWSFRACAKTQRRTSLPLIHIALMQKRNRVPMCRALLAASSSASASASSTCESGDATAGYGSPLANDPLPVGNFTPLFVLMRDAPMSVENDQGESEEPDETQRFEPLGVRVLRWLQCALQCMGARISSTAAIVSVTPSSRGINEDDDDESDGDLAQRFPFQDHEVECGSTLCVCGGWVSKSSALHSVRSASPCVVSDSPFSSSVSARLVRLFLRYGADPRIRAGTFTSDPSFFFDLRVCCGSSAASLPFSRFA